MACRLNIVGNQKIITFTDNYTKLAFQIQGFRSKEAETEIIIEKFFSRTEKL